MSQVPSLPPATADPAATVRALLACGDTKQAVERAKEHHKRVATDASQALLIEAYLARIRALSERGLAAEAKALTDVVWQRFPSARAALTDTGAGVSERAGRVDDLVRPLADPSLPPERRASIEAALRRQLVDPADLARCEALPADHPLRVAAAAVSDALARVTQARVEDDQIALPEVSRKSPLAPWKLLVRAIAALHRRNDDACRELLNAIDADSAPARLLPAMRSILDGRGPTGLKPAAAALVRQIGGEPAALRDALAALDASFKARKRRGILRGIERAVQTCQQSRPDLLQRLRQEISVRCLFVRLPPRALRAALGGPALRTAHFWRLSAHAYEKLGDPFTATACWSEFRDAAIDEGCFEAGSLESAAVLLHQAELLRRLSPEELQEGSEEFRANFKGFAQEYEDQPRVIAETAAKRKRDFSFLSPERLYEEAARIDPDAGTFRKWWEFASNGGQDKKAGEAAALAWHRALPRDARPLLLLMESAEERDALKKALGYLEEAEKLDALDPLVRKARVRLLVATTLRHLRQQKFHLAEKDLAEIEATPQAMEGRRAAFVPAVRALLAVREGREIDVATWRHQASLALGSEAASFLLCWAIADACKVQGPRGWVGPAEPAAKLSDATARVAILGRDIGLPVAIPPAWVDAVRQTVSKDCPLDAEALRALAEAALAQDDQELAYAITGAGLARRGPTTARFLLLRAKSLPWIERRTKCAAAAASLAREQRDTETADEAVEISSRGWFGEEPVAVTAGEVENIIAAELAQKEYPSLDEICDGDDFADSFSFPFGRARRRMSGEEDEDDDELFGLGDLEPPPEFTELMLDAMKKYGRRGDPLTFFENIKKDPELMERLVRIMAKYDIDDLLPFPGGRTGHRR